MPLEGICRRLNVLSHDALEGSLLQEEVQGRVVSLGVVCLLHNGAQRPPDSLSILRENLTATDKFSAD